MKLEATKQVTAQLQDLAVRATATKSWLVAARAALKAATKVSVRKIDGIDDAARASFNSAVETLEGRVARVRTTGSL